jgi:hypothetical protein
MPARSARLAGCFALFCLFLIPTGCATSHIVPESQVPGSYTLRADWGTSTLVLAPDHTFHQTVTRKSGYTKEVRGRWTLERSKGTPVYTAITFQPYLQVTQDIQGNEILAALYSIYPVPFGIEIAADPDHGLVHRKR